MALWRFDNTYARLPGAFFQRATPAPVREPRLVLLNETLARDLGLELDGDPASLFAGQVLPPGADPIAEAYAGHQFGHFAMLGDGRAILLGEHVRLTGERFDIQFKGSGPTAYSRRGDGLAALGPMLREYVVSEAMHALGIPTTRSLAVVATGESVRRETLRPGAILTRVAASHLRVGTFEYAAALGDEGSLRALADYAIARHDPELVDSDPDSGEKYAAFLRAVVLRQARLIAGWQLVGFVHGVMNTDNMAISGETIDYGPCAFLDAYHPDTVFSSIDRDGRYAYGNQPGIAHWNLARFAESLLPLLGDTEDKAVSVATEILNTFPDLFQRAWLTGIHRKLGLSTQDEISAELIAALLLWMERTGADFTNTFRALASPDGAAGASEEFRAWHGRWLLRRRSEAISDAEGLDLMRSANPDVIPRNGLVEAALAAAEEDGDLAPLHELLDVLKDPYAPQAHPSKYHEAAPAGASPYRTFCGT